MGKTIGIELGTTNSCVAVCFFIGKQYGCSMDTVICYAFLSLGYLKPHREHDHRRNRAIAGDQP